jgi:hypothetical protein
MTLQSDLFGEPIAATEPPPGRFTPEAPPVRTLAIPCGFLNSRNKPCRRLGGKTVLIEGSPLVCRGVSMVHCEPDCFRTDAIPARSYDDDEIDWSA